MYEFEKMEQAGYRRTGNWFQDNDFVISLNLATREIKSQKKGVVFSHIYSTPITFEEAERVKSFIESLK